VLVITLRTFIIFIFLLLALRLMGKRQIGELQPFEFVITLAVAELACTPMQDLSTPILYGIIPVAVVFCVHFLLTALGAKSIFFRKFMNGKPVIVIDENGIDAENLKKLNMNVNDLMQSIRNEEYFSVEQVSFAIIETNGKISILPNEQAKAPKSIPLSVIVEGKYIDANMGISDTSREELNKYLKLKNLKLKDVVLLTMESGNVFVQPKGKKYISEAFSVATATEKAAEVGY
jgi:uncharacterized membrane protein YcaP (DUF421 family)